VIDCCLRRFIVELRGAAKTNYALTQCLHIVRIKIIEVQVREPGAGKLRGTRERPGPENKST
jgi:hypothetical protein